MATGQINALETAATGLRDRIKVGAMSRASQAVLGVPVGDAIALLRHIAIHEPSTEETLEHFGWSLSKYKRGLSVLRHLGCEIHPVRDRTRIHFRVIGFGVFDEKALRKHWRRNP